MALGIKKNNGDVTYDIPLVGMKDGNWEDNSWMVEHLRHLADKIEESQIKIHHVGIEVGPNYKIPNLVVKGYDRRKEERMEMPEFPKDGEGLEKYAKLIDEISKIEDLHEFTGHEKLVEKYEVSRQEVNWIIHNAKFGNILLDGIMAFVFAKKK